MVEDLELRGFFAKLHELDAGTKDLSFVIHMLTDDGQDVQGVPHLIELLHLAFGAIHESKFIAEDVIVLTPQLEHGPIVWPDHLVKVVMSLRPLVIIEVVFEYVGFE